MQYSIINSVGEFFDFSLRLRSISYLGNLHFPKTIHETIHSNPLSCTRVPVPFLIVCLFSNIHIQVPVYLDKIIIKTYLGTVDKIMINM